jgi:exopolyphosphatase/guanosine-5'-triphosphate,3'-diphosphate pyrophosphatase
MRSHMTAANPSCLVALGGEARFAASLLVDGWNHAEFARIPLARLAKLADEILPLADDDIVRKHHLPFEEAETLGPALLIYVMLGRAFQVKQVMVSNRTMRDGLLLEMSSRGAWTDEFREQIVLSALELGKRYHFDERHGAQVAAQAQVLFRALQEEHGLDRRCELLLHVAALLHEIGMYVGERSHHKHTMYLIMNSDIFGLGQRDLTIVGMIARYHRRATPRPTHEVYISLSREDRTIIAKLAAILRVADALDRTHSARLQSIQCRREESDMAIYVSGVDDLNLEQLALSEKGAMFEEVYGMRVVLRKMRQGVKT